MAVTVVKSPFDLLHLFAISRDSLSRYEMEHIIGSSQDGQIAGSFLTLKTCMRPGRAFCCSARQKGF